MWEMKSQWVGYRDQAIMAMNAEEFVRAQELEKARAKKR